MIKNSNNKYGFKIIKDFPKTPIRDSLIRDHYIKTKPIIQKNASLNSTWRAGIGDHWNWYAEEKEGKRLWDLTNDSDYQKLTQSHRTLYWRGRKKMSEGEVRQGIKKRLEHFGLSIYTEGGLAFKEI